MKLNNIDGDVAVSGNAAMGGDANVLGSVTIARNLRVEGWLDAKNVKNPGKGLFADEASLKSAYPHPRYGWWAIVGNAMPGRLYAAQGGQWVYTGNSAGDITVEGADCEASLSELQQSFTQLEHSLSTIIGQIANIEETVSHNAAAIESLTADLDGIASNLSNVSQDVLNLLERMQGAETTLTSIRMRISQIEGDIGDLQSDVALNASRIDELFANN